MPPQESTRRMTMDTYMDTKRKRLPAMTGNLLISGSGDRI
jgi:hypothetical protein